LDAGSTTGDFHPISSHPCWAYTIRLHPTVSGFFVKFERLFAAGEANR
jgi:hypothetical protein